MRIRIEDDPLRPGEGCARLVLPGMAGRSAPAVSFTREGFGADSLGPDGWQVATGRLAPIEATEEGDALVLVLGPEAAEHLQPGPVRLGIPALGLDQIVIWPDIPPAVSGRRDGFGAQRRAEAAARRIPQKTAPKPADDATVIVRPPDPAVAPLPETPPIPPPEHPSRTASRLPLLLLLGFAVAAACVAGFMLWPPAGPPPVATAPAQPAPAQPAADPTETATPAEIAAMRLPPARVTEIAQRRAARGRHGDALLLYELAAESQHAPALVALARLYDPASFAAGGALSAPNAVKAAELWRAAERAGETGAAAPRAALRQRLEAAARDGDPLAALALRDFWP